MWTSYWEANYLHPAFDKHRAVLWLVRARWNTPGFGWRSSGRRDTLLWLQSCLCSQALETVWWLMLGPSCVSLVAVFPLVWANASFPVSPASCPTTQWAVCGEHLGGGARSLRPSGLLCPCPPGTLGYSLQYRRLFTSWPTVSQVGLPEASHENAFE